MRCLVLSVLPPSCVSPISAFLLLCLRSLSPCLLIFPQAYALRDSLARALYARLFEIVLSRLNAALSFPESHSKNLIRLIESQGPSFRTVRVREGGRDIEERGSKGEERDEVEED